MKSGMIKCVGFLRGYSLPQCLCKRKCRKTNSEATLVIWARMLLDLPGYNGKKVYVSKTLISLAGYLYQSSLISFMVSFCYVQILSTTQIKGFHGGSDGKESYQELKSFFNDQFLSSG